MNEQERLAKAEKRVRETEALSPHEEVLLRYDWPNWGEHLEWVATAPETEILAWLEKIETP